jgi:F-type H+-transporting ATPase subunit b
MLIDWFTVGAQALNFLILVWLMKRYLYQPIIHALDQREKRIAAELADADAKRADAVQAESAFKAKNAAFDAKRDALLKQAVAEADVEGRRVLEAARAAADNLRSARAESLRQDAEAFQRVLGRATQQEVFAIARKALTDLAGANLEERIADVFVRRLRGLDDQTKARLAEALRGGTEPALVRSAFELPTAQRDLIAQALDATFSAEIPLRFETAPDVVCGIELTRNGRKIAWSIAEYLTSLRANVDQLVQATQRGPNAPARPQDVGDDGR